MNTGKAIQRKQIFRDDENTVIVAMDQCLGGNVSRLDNYSTTVKKIATGSADASSKRVRYHISTEYIKRQ
jgi:DhnA family fructose-bisphosphate aldolase class Ia